MFFFRHSHPLLCRVVGRHRRLVRPPPAASAAAAARVVPVLFRESSHLQHLCGFEERLEKLLRDLHLARVDERDELSQRRGRDAGQDHCRTLCGGDVEKEALKLNRLLRAVSTCVLHYEFG
jgi:hypothetical protein